MKFVHTADILLDRSFAAVGLAPAQGTRCRAHAQQRLHDLLQHARRAQADALFITGNLFDHDRVTRPTLNFLRDALAALDPMPVFICPGTADPAVDGSPWRTEAWPPNVHIFLTGTWSTMDLPGTPLTVHGFGCTAANPRWPDAPLDGPLATERVHVALCPLAAETSDAFPLPGGLAYLGLGGRRDGQPLPPTDLPTWGPGALECYVPGTPTECGHLEIQITPGHPATVERVVTSQGFTGAIHLECGDFSRGQDLLDAVRSALRDLRHCPIVHITLTGTLLRPILEELDGIREALGDDHQQLLWRDLTHIAEDFDAYARERNSLGAFIQRISAEIGDLPEGKLRELRTRSRDLGLCACLGSPLPIRGLSGEYR